MFTVLCYSCAGLIYKHYLLEGPLSFLVSGLYPSILWIEKRNKYLGENLAKVLIECPVCQAGQFALWHELYSGAPLIQALFTACVASAAAHILNDAFFR